MDDLKDSITNRSKKGYTSKAELKPNTFFTGRVTRITKPTETISVMVDGMDVTLDADFIWIAGVMSNMFGFNTTFMPTVNTRVFCYYTGTSPSFIVGCIPDTDFPPLKGRETGSTDENYKKSNVFTSQRRANGTSRYNHYMPFMDITEGELDISNLLGVGVTLLQNFVKIQAGDLAKIECSVIDDFVRIISENYEHHTAFGEFKIKADGNRMNVVWNGSHLEHESWGLFNSDDDRVPYIPDNEADYAEKERHIDTGRWRFSNYIGYLGNFINMFITEPMQQLGKIAEGALPRTGLGRLHVNDDGSIVGQSMNDICFEHVVRIPVPIEEHTDYDPEGNLSTDIPETDPLKKWDFKSEPNMFEAVYQLRDYARWLSNYYTKARFHMLDKDFRVPAETEIAEPLEHGDDEERKKASGPFYYMDLYSCIRIMRDGSIILMDGYANSIVTNKKGVQISSSNNLQIESAGNVNIVAGHDINMVAKRSVSTNAIQEGITMRSKKWFQSICTDNGILLQTDTTYEDDAPDDETHKVGGIVLRANNSKIRLSALKDIEIKSQAGNFLVACLQTFFKTSLFQINNIFKLVSGALAIKATIQATGLIAGKLYGGNVYKSGMGPHPGHVVKKAPTINITSNKADELKSKTDKADFRHATSVQHKTPAKPVEQIYESLTQQQLKLSIPMTVEVQGLETWDLSSECELPGRGSCWPNVGNTQKVYRGGGDDLYIPSGKTVFPNEGSPLTTESISFKVKPD